MKGNKNIIAKSLNTGIYTKMHRYTKKLLSNRSIIHVISGYEYRGYVDNIESNTLTQIAYTKVKNWHSVKTRQQGSACKHYHTLSRQDRTFGGSGKLRYMCNIIITKQIKQIIFEINATSKQRS